MEQVRIVGKGISRPIVLEDLFLGTLYLAGLEPTPLEQLFQLGIRLNHIALTQKDIAVCIVDVPWQGPADGQRARCDSDKFGQIRCLKCGLLIGYSASVTLNAVVAPLTQTVFIRDMEQFYFI